MVARLSPGLVEGSSQRGGASVATGPVSSQWEDGRTLPGSMATRAAA